MLVVIRLTFNEKCFYLNVNSMLWKQFINNLFDLKKKPALMYICFKSIFSKHIGVFCFLKNLFTHLKIIDNL